MDYLDYSEGILLKKYEEVKAWDSICDRHPGLFVNLHGQQGNISEENHSYRYGCFLCVGGAA